MTEELIELWFDDWAHLLDASQPSQQRIDEMREDLATRVAQIALDVAQEGAR